MEILKFKTDVKEEADVAKIKPLLDKEDAISNWSLDTDKEEYILSVSGENVDPQQIENLFKEVGFSCEMIRAVGISGSEL